MSIDPSRFPPAGAMRARGRVPALALGAACLLGLAGCLAPFASERGFGGGAGERSDGPGDRGLAAASVAETVRDLPKSRRGNMAEYTVHGTRYRTLASSVDFRERGVASWYGAKFHGRDTSSGEPFDMHAMTAAHRHLPLPTFVRVTRRDTGRSIVVKVNDRGPFVDDRVIDLSYAAALRLGMLDTGTAEVELEALSTHVVDDVPVVVASTDVTDVTDVVMNDVMDEEGLATGTTAMEIAGALDIIQLGAFSDGERAASMARRAAPHLGSAPRVVHDPERALWRVQVGPFTDAATVRGALAGLAAAGIDGYTLMAVTVP